MDYAANLAAFLLEKTGSVFGEWNGRMTAAEQRALFGQFLGKGLLCIKGETEVIEHWVKSCFGLDADITKTVAWRNL